MENSNQVFREKSLNALSSPEELNNYLHVTRPSVWIMLGAAILVMVGLFIWSSFVSLQSKVRGTAKVSDGVVTVTVDDMNTAGSVETGMILQVGKLEVPLTSVGQDERGKTIAGATAELPDGEYPCEIVYKSTQLLQMMFN